MTPTLIFSGKKFRLEYFSTQIKTIKIFYQQLKKSLTDKVEVWIARNRMKVGIQAVTALHKFYAKKGKYLDMNNRVLRNYIVLLEMPVRNRKGRIVLSERLFWVNRNNFKKIKRQGWLPRTMYIDQLRRQAFYVSDPTRTYQQEYEAKEKAQTKYITYIKSKQQC